MQDNSIYSDISRRCGGDIYIGVVGPVRTGKSTFIRRFVDTVVMPNIESEFDRTRCQDELPQSASGKTVMTTEPKFVPDNAVTVSVGDGTEFRVKLIDCVGYMVDGALGAMEDGEPRLIKTPWQDEPMSFSEAAEIGTAKVIGEHSTIGMLITTDGTICDIPRESYTEAEERVARELSELGKPFAIVLNSAKPNSDEAKSLAVSLEEKYNAPVALVSCPELNSGDIQGILELVLGEFPVRRLDFKLPDWVTALPDGHRLEAELISKVKEVAASVRRLGDITKVTENDNAVEVMRIDAGEGVGELSLPISDSEFYEILSEASGFDLSDKQKLFSLVRELAEMKKRYDKVSDALDDVERSGYGIVMPSPDELTLEEPKTVRTAGGFGVRIAAHAECLHIIKTGIRAELCPMVGTEEQTEEVVKNLVRDFEAQEGSIWDTKLFGKSLYDLVSDGLTSKLSHLPSESRDKLGETIEKIINDGASGLICILL